MTIAILDFGGQYTHLLAQRIRKLNVHSVIIPPTTPDISLYDGLILSGGPHSVNDPNAPLYNEQLFDLDIPILGICYGYQLLCKHFGATIESHNSVEYGKATMRSKKKGLFKKVIDNTVWMSHSDTVIKLPSILKVIAETTDGITAVKHVSKRIYGVQFHPEVKHTEDGDRILKNFTKICKCVYSWSSKNQMTRIINDIKTIDKNVLVLLSGGVDSTVTFALLNKALGTRRVLGLHINNGFMRYKESEQVLQAFEELGMTNYIYVDASQQFYQALKGITDPQEKRKIIGEMFINVQQEQVRKMELDGWILGQGTIYPDTVESGDGSAQVIKTHHNRIDRIQEMIARGEVIEPLSELYKDEVRELGMKLGLPAHLVHRHPFPGPGLAIRTLCVTERVSVDQSIIDNILQGTLLKGYILPVKSVGVQGDYRTYKHPIALIGRADWDTLEDVSTKLINSLQDVNRVVWALAYNGDVKKMIHKVTDVNNRRIQRLQLIDNYVTEYMRENNLYDKIWQCPVVMIPCGIHKGSESIVLRPVNSTEAMTANFARVDFKPLAEKLLSPFINAVFYDITNKPPGTIEWE